jgi:hypothetical protein
MTGKRDWLNNPIAASGVESRPKASVSQPSRFDRWPETRDGTRRDYRHDSPRGPHVRQRALASNGVTFEGSTSNASTQIRDLHSIGGAR